MDKASRLSPAKQALLQQRLKQASRGRVAAPPIPPRPNRDFAPLSFAQRQMWVLDRMTPGNPAYNLPVGYRLRGPLDVTALEDSFNEVIKRHEALRTTFAVKDGEPLQIIHPRLSIKIQVTDLTHLAGEARHQKLQALASDESLTSFDLSRLPLLRVSLFRLGDAEHVLLVNLHHIVADGLSIGLLLGEADAFYRAFTGGSDRRPPDVVLQYADFAQWQRRTLGDEGACATQIEYWRTKLGGELPILELPADKSRPALQSFNGSNVFFDIPRALARDLRALASREGCTFFVTLLAAFQVLLQRYSGAEEIVVGTPVAARAREVEPLIGNFLNMAALRCDVSGNPTFVELLRRSRDTTLDAFSNADLPFEALLKHLTVVRDPGRNPVFQVMLQMLSATAPRIGDLEVSGFHFDLKIAQFDLSLHLYEDAERCVGRFEYCTDVFDAETVERLSSNFQQLLHAIVADPLQKISKIPLVAPSERLQVLTAWNDTSRDYPKDKCLHHLFEETAQHSATRIAVECAGRSLTYGDLHAKANQLAHHLIRSGVGPESFVGVYLERSLDMVVALLGILKAGAAYVPMDPSFPPARLAYMMADAELSALVTQSDLLKALPQPPARAICLDADWNTIQQEPDVNPPVAVNASNLAYTIYTSGSTGEPKGVMIEHGSVVNFLLAMRQKPGFDAHDVLVGVTTISFDIAALEIFLPLISGGRLVLAGRDDVVDGSRLLQLIARSGATTLQATPATWKLLIEAGWKHTPGLRMLCGGEALPRALANRLLERGGELWNMYGPTETTIWSAVQRIEPEREPVLIGPPIANTQFYIVDRELEPVPIGVAGELLIGGDGLSRGYLNRPDLTAQRFLENPFLNSGGRVYRTGDLARFRSDGRVEFLGRMDSQVKVRGYRIELGEIESVLARHEAIEDAVVVTRDVGEGDIRLAAYYVPVADRPPLNARDLRKALEEKLPDYMIPSCFVELKAFPLTPNGKIDRRALPAPDTAVAEGRNLAAPQGELELQLAAIWQRALRKQPIGIDDNFFELGGHSLLAAQMFGRIEEQLGVKLPLALLFQATTIRQLAGHIAQRAWKSSWKSLVPIHTHGDGPPLFLIHGAEGNVLLYRTLAARLGTSHPLYGLQSRGLDGLEPMETTIEGMAAKYLEEIRSAQPKGPYYLSGYCMGGTIALEIAQQLKKQGEPVALLAMFETYNLRDGPPVSFRLHVVHKAQNFYFHLRNLLLSLSGGPSGFFREKLKVELRRWRMNADSLRSRVRVVNDQAQAAYRPAPYDGRIILFKTKTHFHEFNDRHFGWQSVAGQGVRVVEMPNYPRASMNDPFVEVLAERLRTEIDNAAHSDAEAAPVAPPAPLRMVVSKYRDIDAPPTSSLNWTEAGSR
jgi:amino acid adenylation domain-containing protein